MSESGLPKAEFLNWLDQRIEELEKHILFGAGRDATLRRYKRVLELIGRRYRIEAAK